jgi:hypothetical protein
MSLDREKTRLLPILLVSLLILFFSIRVTSFWLADTAHLVTQFEDDAFYYFKIAQNIVAEHIVTFDGQNRTNGFHPLWLLMLLPVFLATQDAIFALRIVGTFSNLLLAAGYCFALGFILPRYSVFICSICTALAIYYGRILSRCNLETSVLIPLAVLSLVLFARIEATSDSRGATAKLLLLGCLLSLLQLSRLDAVFLSLTIVLFVVLRLVSMDRLPVARLCAIAGPPALTGTAYLSYNLLSFGWVTPVSSVSKSMGTEIINYMFFRQVTHSPSWMAYLGMLILAFYCLVTYARDAISHARAPEANANTAFVVSVFMITYTTYHLFCTSWLLWNWYLYPAVLASFFVVPVFLDSALEKLWGKMPRYEVKATDYAIWGCVLAFFVVAALVVWEVMWLSRNVEHSYTYQNYRLAARLNDKLRSHPKLAMGDRCGSFAYFYRGNVLQLEGLVGDYQIVEAIRANTLGDYITKQRVEYIVSWTQPREDYTEFRLINPDPRLSLGPYAELILCRESQVLREDTKAGTVCVWSWPSCTR